MGNKNRLKFLDHCIDILRQAVTCASDVTVATSNWIQNHPRPYPDFNTMHKCWDFDVVRKWAVFNDQGSVEEMTSDAVVLLDSPLNN